MGRPPIRVSFGAIRVVVRTSGVEAQSGRAPIERSVRRQFLGNNVLLGVFDQRRTRELALVLLTLIGRSQQEFAVADAAYVAEAVGAVLDSPSPTQGQSDGPAADRPDLLDVARPTHRKTLRSPHALEQGAIGPLRGAARAMPGRPISTGLVSGPCACSAAGLPSRRPVARMSQKLPPTRSPCPGFVKQHGRQRA